MFSNARAFASQYSRVDLETGVASNDPHRLIAMLFDGLLDRLRIADDALGNGDLVTKSHALGRAIRILDEGLKASLDMRAGDLSERLSMLYVYSCMRLMEGNARNDRAPLAEVRRLIEPLRDAWQAIGPQVMGRPAATAVAADMPAMTLSARAPTALRSAYAA